MVTVKKVILAACAAFVALAAVLSARQQDEPGPWSAGRCYRASFLDPAQQENLRVLESPAGPWVRVQADPKFPRVPGAPPRARVWLNTATVFAITEIECSSFPGD